MYRFKPSRDLQYPTYPTREGLYQPLVKNTPYVIESIYLKELLDVDPDLEAIPWPKCKDKLPENDLKGARLLLVRGYGIGDILFLTPLVRQLKKQWPHLEVCVACQSDYVAIFENTGSFDRVLPQPLSESFLESFDHIFLFENVVEKNPLANKRHISDLFADHMGLELEDKSTHYRLSDQEVQQALTHYPKSDRLRIGLQLHASSPVRSYPQNRIYELIQLGIQKGLEWVVMGNPGSCKNLMHPQVINMTHQTPEASVRESLAMMASCDGFIGPDSALTHFAGALSLPTIALYASFDSKLRVAYQSSIYAIEAKAPCAPCFHHSKPHLGVMPPQCPGKLSLKCIALESILPEVILNSLLDRISHAPC